MKAKRPVLPKEIFLSHASGDRRFATKIASLLRKNGIAVWYSRTHLRGAQRWQKEIGKALQRCDWFVVVLSPKSVKSMWVERELSFALNQKRYQDKIVPILLRKCNHQKLNWTLTSFQIVNFTGVFSDGYQDLLKIWRL